MIPLLLAMGSVYSFQSSSPHLAMLLGVVAIILVTIDTLFGEDETR
jgi:hypothetical protein